jgi:hypothetical protein
MKVCFMSEQEIRDIFSDEAYVSSLLALDTPEEVQASLAEKDLDLSAAEITTILDSIQKYSEADGELSEADLETVTGGFLTGILLAMIITLVVGTGGVVGAADAIRRRW